MRRQRRHLQLRGGDVRSRHGAHVRATNRGGAGVDLVGAEFAVAVWNLGVGAIGHGDHRAAPVIERSACVWTRLHVATQEIRARHRTNDGGVNVVRGDVR